MFSNEAHLHPTSMGAIAIMWRALLALLALL